MFPTEKCYFKVERREFAGKPKDYALYVRFSPERDRWVLYTWEKKPSKDEIKDIICLITRSFQIYHQSLTIPRFKLDVEDMTSELP